MSSLQEQNNEHSLQESVDKTYTFPTSFAQQRLWFLDRLLGASGLYNTTWAVQLNGKLDVSALQQNLNTIVARHEVLRTYFVEEDGEPVQVIRASIPFTCTLMALSAHSQEHRDSEIQRILDAEGNKPFDLKEAPLIRALLLKLSEQEHILLVTIHHIVADSWSRGVFRQELASLYGAFSQGQSAALSELPVQYADYAVWQREWFQGEELEKQLNYWKTQLADLTVLELPTDRPRPKQLSYLGAQQTIHLSAALTRGLKTLSQQQGVTLFMTLLAAFQVLLHRYSGQDDIVVGTAIAGRNRQEIENLIGFFANTLALRTDLSDAPSFVHLLNRVREVCLSAYAHQDMPFEKLVAELQIQRDMSRHPLFQVMLVLHPTALQDLQLPGLTISKLTVSNETAKFDLELSLVEYPDGLKGTIEYNTDLFNTETITRLAGHFQTLLEAIVEHPDTAIAELPLLTAQERHQLLVEWNATQTDYPKHKCIHQLFEEQVARTPDAIAVVFEEQQLSYQALNAKANQLAHYLRTLGVGPDTLVGICVERGPDMIVGLFGILKAGGAYVPLDPAYPKERLAFMLEDSAPLVLLTETKTKAILTGAADYIPRVDLAADRALWAGQSEINLNLQEIGLVPENLAYVIFTSGSTGQPKGAMNEHRGVVNRLNWMQRTYGLGQRDAVLQKTPFSFDVSVWEFFWPLFTGARLVMAKPEGHKEPGYLVEIIRRENITTLHFVPPMLQVFLEHKDATSCTSLLRVICSGEALPGTLVKRFHEQLPETGLHNLYGPTEAAVDVTAWACVAGSPIASTPIGRPIDNTRIYILDPHGEPVPIGVTGELYIGGVQVGRGYLNHPELTAERFLPDPFAGEPAARMYKTGDLARYLPDGTIEFLGRIDHQVKLRGFRIELGEIESVMGQYPDINEALVTVREDQPGDKRLVAYLTHSQHELPNVNTLHLFLKEKLPEYMVPAAFVLLDKLPLTPNGKIDRKALPAPNQTRPEFEQSYVPPRSPIEEMLVAIWREVLNIDRIGIHDNFFELGGHSLLVVQMLSRVWDVFGVELNLRRMFEHPTVAGLAREIEGAQPGIAQRPPIRPVPRGEELPLSFSQERFWIVSQMDPQNPVYNCLKVTRILGLLDVMVLEQCLAAVVARHEVLRANFLIRDGRPVQVIAESRSTALRVVDLAAFPVREREARADWMVREEMQCPFDLARDPLLRGLLLRFGPEEHVLVLTNHHIVSDAWSVSVLHREMAALYRALCAGESSPLPPLVVQYADFAAWQRQWMQSGGLDAELAYWRKQLQGLSTLQLPTDRARPRVQTFAGARQFFTLPGRLSESLTSLSHREGVSLFMTVVAAFQTLLHRYSGQDDIAVGSPVATRNRVETEPLIGCFLNTLVLRTDCSGAPSFRELLGRVREVTLDALAHQELPFEKLVEALNPERDLSRQPLIQVMVNMHVFPDEDLTLPGLKLLPLNYFAVGSMFDLMLFYCYTPDGCLRFTLQYSTDLFNAETITRLVGHFQTLLEAIALRPETAIAELPLLTAPERHQLLVEWNATQTDYPKDKCIHQLFEEQVARTPDAIAVVFEDQQLSYQALNEKANQLAHYLSSLNIGPEKLVGICLERSLYMLVALLGILKAGGGYLPLDPTYPKARLKFMLADAQAPVLLTHTGQIEKLPETNTLIIYVDKLDNTLSTFSTHNPSNITKPENLAYILYTSGSTGAPKGVTMHHRALINLLHWQTDGLKQTQYRRILQFTSLNFDVSFQEIFTALTTGSCLVLISEEQRRDPQLLLTTLVKQKVTDLYLPFIALQQLAHTNTTAYEKNHLKVIITAGEQLHITPAIKLFIKNIEGCQLINQYGPTECHVVTSFNLPKNITDWAEFPSIGRPIDNTEIYILDRSRQPAPIGVAGEIYIGGDGLARGYYNRPELTAEKFIKHPFSDDPHARLYKTGDLARYLPDGTIEFLGRIDNQVKIRGFRIELGEIESVLGLYPGINEALVTVREDQPGDKRLVAYLTHSQHELPNVNAIRLFLKEKLPEYMVPSAFVLLDKLPLTPNGKIDRNALPAPDYSRHQLEQSYAPPRTPIEEMLVAIWREVLNIDRIGIHDNFFELGGHSLLAVQLVVRINQQFQIDFPLYSLFEEPTVAGLSVQLETILKQENPNTITSIKALHRKLYQIK